MFGQKPFWVSESLSKVVIHQRSSSIKERLLNLTRPAWLARADRKLSRGDGWLDQLVIKTTQPAWALAELVKKYNFKHLMLLKNPFKLT